VSIGLSVVLMAFYVWIYEYMIGLEVMRISLLYWVQWRDKPDAFFATARKTFLKYIPYILVVVLFVIWRILIFHSTRLPPI